MNKETISKINSIIKPDTELISKTKDAVYNSNKKNLYIIISKKIIITAATFLFIIFISVFSFSEFELLKPENIVNIFENSEETNSANQHNITEDNNLGYNKEIDITMSVSAKNDKSVKIDMGDVSMSSPIVTDEEKFEIENSVVLRGKVVDSHYVLDGSTVYTKSEVEIIDCYQGNLAEGDTIFVRELGGFVPSDVYSNAIHSEKYGNDIITDDNVESEILDVRIEDFKVLETSEEVILFLVPVTQSGLDEFTNGCYDLIRMWQGKLLYDEEYDAYVPYIPEYELASEITNNTSTYQVKNSDSSNGTVQAKIYSLEEFESFAETIITKEK